MRSNVLGPVVAGILLVATGAAEAGSKTTTLPVSATVASNCIVSAGNLSFGTYDGSAAKTGSSDISVRCSNGTGYTVKLSAGGGTYAQRLLTFGANTLQYNLFTASDLASVWGDGTASTFTVAAVGTGLSAAGQATHTVYGELPNTATNQDAPVGTYNDTITVTVEY